MSAWGLRASLTIVAAAGLLAPALDAKRRCAAGQARRHLRNGQRRAHAAERVLRA